MRMSSGDVCGFPSRIIKGDRLCGGCREVIVVIVVIINGEFTRTRTHTNAQTHKHTQTRMQSNMLWDSDGWDQRSCHHRPNTSWCVRVECFMCGIVVHLVGDFVQMDSDRIDCVCVVVV